MYKPRFDKTFGIGYNVFEKVDSGINAVISQILSSPIL